MLISTINRYNVESMYHAFDYKTDEVKRAATEAGSMGISAWISLLKEIRLEDLLQKMREIDFRETEAIDELKELSSSVEKLIASKRGGETGIHGFIGERAQVYLSNAWSIVRGSVRIDELIDDNGMTDYLENGIPVQQKACRAGGKIGLDHILQHSRKYPDFAGKYQIPKDFYNEYCRLEKLTQIEAGKLSRQEWNLWLEIQKVKKANISIEPMILDYDDIQRNTIYDSIDCQRDEIRETISNQKEVVMKAHRPSFQEGIVTTAASACVEGVLSGASKVVEKRIEGKRVRDYTRKDVKDIGAATLKGSGKGAIRGTVIYLSENYTPIPGYIAGGAVSVAFDSAKAVKECCDGRITKAECISEIGKSALTTTVGSLGAKLGGKLCPVPVLGEVIGGFIGSFVAGKGIKLIAGRKLLLPSEEIQSA